MSSNDFGERYQRQLLLPEVGEKGQLLLAQKRVIVVGAGGLGCTILPLLVGSGIGHLVICDNDVVSLSNLPRQTLYTESQIGQSKAKLAAAHLHASNPNCTIQVYGDYLMPMLKRILFHGSILRWKVGEVSLHFLMAIISLTELYSLRIPLPSKELLLLPTHLFR